MLTAQTKRRQQKRRTQKQKQRREKLKAPKCPPEYSTTGSREPKMVQNEAIDATRRFQKEAKRVRKEIPNRKTKKGPNQDHPKTVLDRPWAD